jgi:phosphoserine phosphatase
MLEVRDFEDRLFTTSVETVLSSKIEVVSDYTRFTHKYVVGGYPISDEVRIASLPKAIDFDFDETLTADGYVGFSVYLGWLEYLNPYIGPKERREIAKIASEFAPGNIEVPASKIVQKYREYNVTRSEHLLACRLAADEIKMAPGYLPTIRKLRDMNYVIGLKSGSPDELIKDCYRNYIEVQTRWEEENFDVLAKGTEYIFTPGPTGKLIGLNVILHENKTDVSRRFAERVTGQWNGLKIAVGDQPGDAYMVSSTVCPFLMLGKSERSDVPADIVISLPEAREDLGKILDPIKRYEYALYEHYEFDEMEKMKIQLYAGTAKDLFARIRNKQFKNLRELKSLRYNLLDSLESYFKISKKLVPIRLAKIDDKISWVKKARKSKDIVKNTRSLQNKLSEYSIHFHQMSD